MIDIKPIHVMGFVASGASDFGQQTAEWSGYFSAFAQVSGGLVGLVFVALTFNGRLGAAGNLALRDLARQTFADFLSVLVISLVLLAPRLSPLSAAPFIFISGLLGAQRILRSLLSMLRRAAWRNASRQVVSRFLLSMLGNSGLLLAGALLIVPDHDPATFWSTLFGSMIGLLLSGSRSAWMLVTHDA